MMRTICVLTGTRAEYGLLKGVIAGIHEDPDLQLQLLVTGMHLSPEFGLTYREIEQDGFPIARKVEMLTSSDTPAGIAKAMGLGLIGYADAFAELRPDVLVVLGDRFEAFAAVAAALVARIPVAHLHGGEATEGLIDEALRHAITKMAHLHFVAAEPYRQRVVQLGESPERVHLVGGLGVDAIRRTPLLDRAALEAALGFRFQRRNLLVTFHPVTLEAATASEQLDALLAALAELDDTGIVITLPNADTEGRALIRQLEAYAANRPHVGVFASLGLVRYLSCMAVVDGVVGNSSSGLLEAPSFHTGTVDIGDRQRGRLRADSVLHCEPRREAIQAAIATLFSEAFRARLHLVHNPYGDGGASERIVRVLKSQPLDGLLKKRFHDVATA